MLTTLKLNSFVFFLQVQNVQNKLCLLTEYTSRVTLQPCQSSAQFQVRSRVLCKVYSLYSEHIIGCCCFMVVVVITLCLRFTYTVYLIILWCNAAPVPPSVQTAFPFSEIKWLLLSSSLSTTKRHQRQHSYYQGYRCLAVPRRVQQRPLYVRTEC